MVLCPMVLKKVVKIMSLSEDERDLQTYYEAMEKFRENPITYTLDEVEAILGIEFMGADGSAAE